MDDVAEAAWLALRPLVMRRYGVVAAIAPCTKLAVVLALTLALAVALALVSVPGPLG